MSGRFVRASKYRHVHAVPAKPAGSFLGVSVATSGDGNYIHSNGKYIVYSLGSRGGGGPVRIHRTDQPGRLAARLPTYTVHKAKVLDFAFSPFNDDMLATCAEDNLVKISTLKDGWTSHIDNKQGDIKEADITMHGNEKKVTGLQWHPTANGVLATSGFDHTARVFNVETQSVVLTYQHDDACNHVRWNRDGSQLASTSKDKKIRIFDPRQQETAQVCHGFDGAKKASVEWCKNNMIAATGFNRTSTRQIKLWDVRMMNEAKRATKTIDLDQSAGVLIPYYDWDSSILYVGGKGDGTIKYFELVEDSPYLHFLSAFSDTKSQKGFCFGPKRACDTTVCEIGPCYRIVGDSIIPTSFRVPRKNADTFQSDIFPDSYAGTPSQTADEYFAGGNSEVVTMSMNPDNRTDRVATETTVKKTYAELETELAAALARIAELEAAQA
jgi:coronin-1B/1C/6